MTKGYVIVRNAVPADNVERLVDLLWQFDEKDPNDPSTWYAPQRRDHIMKELNGTGMVEIYNHQYLWDNRMEQRVYDAFVDIWDMRRPLGHDRPRQPQPAQEGARATRTASSTGTSTPRSIRCRSACRAC